jgi:hypothetical protein
MADLAATSGKLQEIEDAKPILVFRNAYTEIVNVNQNGIVVLTANVLRLKIENASQHHYPNNEAKNVTATISFYDQSNRVLVADMDARWTASTQPVGPHTLSIVPLLGMDFPIGSKRDLDIAFAETTYIKMPIPELVALNNDNFHFQRWRKREHVLARRALHSQGSHQRRLGEHRMLCGILGLASRRDWISRCLGSRQFLVFQHRSGEQLEQCVTKQERVIPIVEPEGHFI